MDSTSLMKEVALSHPNVARTLDKLRLNYCCDNGGRASLAEACQNAGMEVAVVLAELERAQLLTATDASPEAYGSPKALIGHILDRHHAFTRSELSRLQSLLTRLQERHGESRPELPAIAQCFQALSDDLLPHLLKEENILFPYVVALEQHREHASALPDTCFGSVENPLRQMELEHDNVRALLARMRQLTNNYTPPPEVCTRYRITLQSLECLEVDLIQHIHLENDVLFPLARRMEATG